MSHTVLFRAAISPASPTPLFLEGRGIGSSINLSGITDPSASCPLFLGGGGRERV
jgi:hypothetical protein